LFICISMTELTKNVLMLKYWTELIYRDTIKYVFIMEVMLC
jgi:hypothetical protein